MRENNATAPNSVLPNPMGLTPILLFVVLVVVTGVTTNDITAMPILVAFFISAGYGLCLNPKGKKVSFSEKVQTFCQGGGDKNIILLVLIFLLAGAFYAVTIDIGARDATVNMALQFVPSALILPGLFLICCFISFSMGTSMGTITALSPIGAGLATNLGLPIEMALGIVVGGAMFGDNLSFVSDTTIAATRTQGVQLKDKFRANLMVALPACIVTMALLLMVDVDTSGIVEGGNYDSWRIVPYLCIIAFALTGFNVISVLAVGIASACVVGLVQSSFTMLSMMQSIQKGMGWMQDLAMIAITIGGIVALMHANGGITWLIERLTRRVTSKKGAEFSIAGLVSFLDITTANNTIAIVTAGPIAKDLNEKYGVDPRRTASLLDIFSCSFQGLVPYGAQLLSAAAVVGISPLAITPYCWYPMLIFVFGVAAIWFGFPRFNTPQDDELTQSA
ncbi:Na+/H+ antiporter NhaC family protein [Alteromonas mediterranea]|uniref:Na+/H+ antiporter NhaC family protein n=1 Tax=Alteromonas mediterranea TaxID=314275 RepID=UPI001131A431|nr:Na+/H+ antiporter NhaC family protein [Alteromonas mediterranea]QDG34602.1 Na+/H+ antiporter NhaC family protein [Alteromonas mediterranea]